MPTIFFRCHGGAPLAPPWQGLWAYVYEYLVGQVAYSHVGSQALGEDRHDLVDVFSRHLFPNGLQSDFQLISCLMLRLEFMILFQHGAPDVIVQWVQIWRA